MNTKRIAIGCSSGFWGDSAYAAEQLVHSGKIQYLVSDYLAEITMSLLARAKAKAPEAGYAPDFVRSLTPLLGEIKRQGIRVVSNAGGMNPRACREAIEKAALSLGLSFNIAIVEGDDLIDQLDELRARAPVDMSSAQPLPAKLSSCNAYLGAQPIASALNQGADIVITGRCVDSAVTLGILIHEYAWGENDFDLLAAGSLAGHVIECGPQCTGGIFTDWQDVADGWDNMGYPIVECHANGEFIVTKPEGTGGLVSVGTVSEQILYEIGNPSAYHLPDVTCDFRQVTAEQIASNRVLVKGARGSAPTSTYKVCATWDDGWKVMATLLLAGRQSGARARRMGQAIVERTRRINIELGRADYREVSIEVIGSEETYGSSEVRNPELAEGAREVVLKMGLRHQDRAALELFAQEMMQAGVAMAQGTTGVFGGRPAPTPVLRLFSFLLDKGKVVARVDFQGRVTTVRTHPGERTNEYAEPITPDEDVDLADAVTVPLVELAWARSGDKGNDANVGIIARDKALLPILRRELSGQRIKAFFSGYVQGEVLRWELSGLNALNFLLKDALGGGGVASLRYDPQGKTFAQMLLDLPIRVPKSLLKQTS